MAKITWVQPDGKSQTFNIPNGTSVMRGAVDNKVPGILAECGGGCACGTCKVYVDDAWIDRVGPRNPLELSIIGDLIQPGEYLRLSCQIEVTDALDGLVVRVPVKQR